jgi:asparagine synthase (glutamine-hydrolysing)
MCGIAGYIDFERPPEETMLRAMEHCLTHRGPDEGRTWQRGPCGLAQRRLKIIDLSPSAAQPMSNEDQRLWLVFNGEIYNFQGLRKELSGLGHRFRSRSDTEVILHGFESWGLNVFQRLHGMFAIAIWDQRASELILARDRVGKKPLFYSRGPTRFVFGSELPVFKCVPDFKLSISKASLREYAEYGYVQSPNSILEGIQRLPAGYIAVWNRTGFRSQSFWSLPTQMFAPHPHDNSQEAAAALKGVLKDSVVNRLQSDVPLGCFLSGGVDSSLVAALAQESLQGKLKTYTVGFENSAMNEAIHARKIAQHLGTEHHELMVDQQSVLAEFESILALAPEPLGDDSFVPTYLISRETRRHVTVAISGDGGDELFAGYKKYHQFATARRWQGRLPIPWQLLSRFPLNDRLRKSLEALTASSPMELARWLSSLWKPQELSQLLSPASGGAVARDVFEESWQARADYSELERWMLVDMETYLEGDILAKVDRASMAVGLEVRSPFLDHQVIEETLKWRCHAESAKGGKAILRTLLAEYLPKKLFLRPKQGFGMPVEQWFRGALRESLLRYTHPKRTEQRGLFNPTLLRAVVQEHLDGRRNFARKLYAIVAFEIWADRFFGEGASLG